MDPLSAALELGTSVINKIWPDPVKQAEEQRKLQELFQQGNLAKLNAQVQLLTGQMNINMEEAKHPSVFVAGARPFVIWIGGFTLAWVGICHPMLLWAWAFFGVDGTPPPMIESDNLFNIVAALLGVGGMRSFDKTKGTATTRVNKK